MNIDTATDFYIAHVDQPYGSRFAATVGRFQEGFLKDRVTNDIDVAFVKAVEVTKRLLPAIKAAA